METNHVNYLERSLPRTDRLLTEWKYTSTYSHYEFLRFKRVNFEYRTDLSNKISQEDLLAMYEAFEEFTLIEKSKLYLGRSQKLRIPFYKHTPSTGYRIG